MDNLTQITTHETDALNRLASQYKDSGNFKNLVSVFAARWQGIEDAAWAVIEGRYITNATGRTLELQGNHVGKDRPVYGPGSDNDDTYRVLILAKIAQNISQGTAPDLYNVLGSLQTTETRFIPKYPASFTVNYIPGTLTFSCACVRNILESASHPIAFDITAHSARPFGFKGNTRAAGWGIGRLGHSI